jgi:hypothetical protein
MEVRDVPDANSPPPRKACGDFTLHLGEHRFDPVAAPVRRRRVRRAPAERAAEPATPPAAAPTAEEATARAAEPAPDPADTRIVQFTQALSVQDITRLRERYGLALTVYVPNYAYVERVPPRVLRRLRRDPLVRAIVPYLPEFKISASIAALGRPRAGGVPEGSDRLEAYLFDRGSLDRVRAALEGMRARDIVAFDDRPNGGFPGVRFTVDDGVTLAPIAELDDVRWIGPVPPLTSDDVPAMSQIQSGDPGNPSIWARGLHGEGQVIGMIDEGPIDIRHCFFADLPPNTPGPNHRKVIAIRNASNQPLNSHATFVAGCAAGDTMTLHPNRGGAFAAKLVCGNYVDFQHQGANTLLTELETARLTGAFIHTNSWHERTAAPGQPPLYTANAADVDRFTFNNEDHLVIGSAGNTAENHFGPPGRCGQNKQAVRHEHSRCRHQLTHRVHPEAATGPASPRPVTG